MPTEALIGLYSSTVRKSLTLKTQEDFTQKNWEAIIFQNAVIKAPKHLQLACDLAL